MRGRPARTPGPAVLTVLAVALTATLAVAVAPARALGAPPPPVVPAVRAAADTSDVTPSTLHFGTLEPGETAAQTATLTTDAPAGSVYVRALASGTGTLADHLATSVEACDVPWTTAGCSTGAGVLLEGAVAPGVDTTLDVPVPASDVTYLRVTLALDATAPPGGAGTVSYELHVLGPDAPLPPQPPGPGPGPAPGPLPVTGVEAAALGAAALALTALGVALRTWVRERRRPVRGWKP